MVSESWGVEARQTTANLGGPHGPFGPFVVRRALLGSHPERMCRRGNRRPRSLRRGIGVPRSRLCAASCPESVNPVDEAFRVDLLDLHRRC